MDPAHSLLYGDLLETLFSFWRDESTLKGVILFGSRARETFHEDSDWDLGIIHTRDTLPEPVFENWDLFFWSQGRWERGFALQLELARKSLVLYDPDQIVSKRIHFLRDYVLPRWEKQLHRR